MSGCVALACLFGNMWLSLIVLLGALCHNSLLRTELLKTCPACLENAPLAGIAACSCLAVFAHTFENATLQKALFQKALLATDFVVLYDEK